MSDRPTVKLSHVLLIGDPSKSVWHGSFIATYVTYPALGVSILTSLKRLEGGAA